MYCQHRSSDPSAKGVRREKSEDDVVDMRAERDIKHGQEVLSCYEEGISDGKLLVEWGFVEGNQGLLNWGYRDVLDGRTGRIFLALRERGLIKSSEGKGMVVGGDEGLGMRIHPGGGVSTGLLLGVFLGLGDHDVEDVENIEKGFLSLLGDLESVPSALSSKQKGMVHQVAKGIMDQLANRHSRMFRSDLSLDQLRELQKVRQLIFLLERGKRY
jgi:hypothetical protein